METVEKLPNITNDLALQVLIKYLDLSVRQESVMFLEKIYKSLADLHGREEIIDLDNMWGDSPSYQRTIMAESVVMILGLSSEEDLTQVNEELDEVLSLFEDAEAQASEEDPDEVDIDDDDDDDDSSDDYDDDAADDDDDDE